MDRGSIPRSLVAAGVLKVPEGRRQVFAPDTVVARVARLARAADHVHARRSGDSLDHFRGPGAAEHDRAGDLQPAPTRMEGQLEQCDLPELLRELVDRRHDRGLWRARRASLRRAVRDRRQRRRHRRGHARIDQPDGRPGSRPAPLGPRRHDRAIDDARQFAGGRRLQCLDATGPRSVLRHLSCAADQGRRAHAVDGGRLRRRPPRLVGAVAARTIYAERSADRNRPRQRSRDHSRCLRPPAVDRPWLLPLDAVVETRRAGLFVCRRAGTHVELAPTSSTAARWARRSTTSASPIG